MSTEAEMSGHKGAGGDTLGTFFFLGAEQGASQQQFASSSSGAAQRREGAGQLGATLAEAGQESWWTGAASKVVQQLGAITGTEGGE